MTQLISGGVVSVEDGTKAKEEYAPARKVRVELHFTVPDGTDEGERMLDAVADLASHKVAELLGAQSSVAKPKAKSAAKAAEPKAEEPKPAGKAALAAAQGLPSADASTVSLDDIGEAQKPAEAEVMDEGLDDLLGEKPVSDADLVSATTKKNSEIQNAVAIRALIAEFAGPVPKQVRDIPTDKRGAYLTELAALKKEKTMLVRLTPALSTS